MRPDSQALPRGWSRADLGTLGKYLNGRGFKKSEWSDNGRPIIRIQNLTGSSAEFNHFEGSVRPEHEVEPGNLLVSWAATLGAYLWRGPSAVLNQHIFKVESFINQDFHYYALRWALEALYRSAHGSGMVHITKSEFDRTPILLPPPTEQRRIVEAIESYFTRLDDAVATLERVRRNMKRYRASVLRAAVEGRLVPTEAELARAEVREYEPASVLLERILAERRRRWEEAELAKMAAKGRTPKDDKWKARLLEPLAVDDTSLPALPEGWVYCTIPMIVEPTPSGMKTGPFGSLLKKHEHHRSGIPVLGIENIEPMCFVPGSKIHISPQKAAQLSAYDVVPGDVLISRSGTVGQVCVAPEELGESRFSTNVMRVRLLSARPLADFLTLALNGSPFVRNQITELCKGTTRDFLNQSILSQLVLPVPPLEEQHRILGEVRRQLSVAAAMEAGASQNRRRLSQLRQSILKWAFEGRLVNQDPTDEPASALLVRIHAEWASSTNKQHPKRSERRKLRSTKA